jgi:uncharacterized delta-60 repeat protein
MKRTIPLLMMVLMVLGFASPALAAPGDLDTTFGNKGMVVTRFFDSDGSAQFSPGDDLAIQPDGKVVVAGGAFLARYNPTGTLDPSFDGDGKVVSDGISRDLAIQPDGKIVVVGQNSSRDSSGQIDFDFQVLRYNADGSPDATFSGDGRLTTPVGPANAFDSAHGVVVQPDSKIVVVGHSNGDIALVRYNSDGSLDTSFGTDGKLTTDIESGKDAASDIALQPEDDKIVIAGQSGHTTNEVGVTTDDDFVVARYNSDGSLDTSFDTDGKLTTTFGSGKDGASTLALQPDGKIVVAGSSQHATQANGNTINDFALARYNSDGSLDTSFGTDGKLTTAIGTDDDVATDLILQDDGKIVAAGRTATVMGDVSRQHNLALVRYNLDGSLDPLFDADGKVRGPVVNQQNVAAGLQASGKIFVSGTSPDQAQLLARYYGGDDATPPETTINSGPSGFVRGTSASFGFSSSELGSTFECRLDGATYNGCDSPKSFSALPDGPHTFRVRATDSNGNVDASPASRTWTVDTVSPQGTVLINGGATTTTSRTVTLRLSANDPSPASGVAHMRFRSENTTTWSSWQTYATSKAWTLSSGAGTKTVYAQYRDRAGNLSAPARDTIKYSP